MQIDNNQVVQSARKTAKARSIRQSVTMPAQLAREVRRVAKERNVTMSRALVTLAERGIEAEAAARAKLTTAHEKFMAESDPARRNFAQFERGEFFTAEQSQADMEKRKAAWLREQPR